MSLVGRTCVRNGERSPSSLLNRVSAASLPRPITSCATTVTPGRSMSESGKSSNPTMATVSSTPRVRSALQAPMVMRFWLVNSAVGGSGRRSMRVAASIPASSELASCHTICSSSEMRASSSAWV